MYQVYEINSGRTVRNCMSEQGAERVVDSYNESSKWTGSDEQFDVRFVIPVRVATA